MSLRDAIATAVVKIVPDLKDFNAQVKDGIEKSVKSTAAFDRLGDSATKLSKVIATAGIGAIFAKAGKSASDLNESINAVQVTFKGASAGVLKLGQDAAKSMGLSNVAFNSLAVQFSAFSKTIAGSGGNVTGTLKELTQRAADFASVMNIDVANAAVLFQSGLAGETEPLRRFGIDLSAASVSAFAAKNGIGELGRELTEQEKTQARYRSLMEQTSKTQGDFANTSGGAANASRIARAELENASAAMGKAFLPAMAAGSQAIGKLAEGFIALNTASGGWVSKGVGLAAAGIAVATGLSFVVGQVVKMHERFVILKGSMINAEGGLTNLGKAARGTAIAVVGVTAAIEALQILDQLTQNSGRAKDAMNAFIVEMHAVRGGLDETAASVNALAKLTDELEQSKGLKSQAWDGLKDGLGHVTLSASGTAIRLAELREALKKIGDTSPQDLQQVLDALGAMQGRAQLGDKAAQDFLKTWGLTPAVIEGFTRSANLATDAQKALNDTTDDATANADATQAAYADLTRAYAINSAGMQRAHDEQIQASKEAADVAIQSVKDIIGSYKMQQDALDRLRKSVEDELSSARDANRAHLDAESADLRVSEAVRKYNEALKGTPPNLKQVQSAQDALTTAQLAYNKSLEVTPTSELDKDKALLRLQESQAKLQDIINGPSTTDKEQAHLDAAEALDRYTKTMADGKSSVLDRQKVLVDLHKAQEKVIQIDRVSSASDLDRKKATIDVTDAQAEYDKALKGTSASADEQANALQRVKDAEAALKDASKVTIATEAEKKQAFIDVQTAVNDAAKAHENEAGILANAAGDHYGVRDAVDAEITALENLEKGLKGPLHDAIHEHIKQLRDATVQAEALILAHAGIILAPPGSPESYIDPGGSYAPTFGEGGRVPGPRGKPILIRAHGGEWVTPNSELAGQRYLTGDYASPRPDRNQPQAAPQSMTPMWPDQMTLIIEGTPVTAIVQKQNRAMAAALAAGRR